MATSPNILPPCPTQMATLHAAYEAAWVAYNNLDVPGIGVRRRSPVVMKAMDELNGQTQRLSLAIMYSQPTTQNDLVILALHIAATAESAADGFEDAGSAVIAASDAMLAYLVRNGGAAPDGDCAACTIEDATTRVDARSMGIGEAA